MRILHLVLIVFLALILVGCNRESMPYKSLADTRPSTPTGNVVGVQKDTAKMAETVAVDTETSLKTEEVAPTGPSCKDSDYGKRTDFAGTVRGIDEYGAEYENSDTCFNGNIYEYYCEGNMAKVVQDKCPRGCNNGFCI
jgi:hypothetical protein